VSNQAQTASGVEENARRSAESLSVILRMEQALAANANDMETYFHEDFRWLGNTGCGTKIGLAAFRSNWQLPLRAAFTDRDYKTTKFMADGDWVSCFGHIEGTHSGTFMGIAPTNKRVVIRYTDFWRIEDGRIKDNWVTVDFAHVLAQLGHDVFAGQGWEAFDRGESQPPKPLNS
jgi:predicted ester cyclase